MSIFEKIKDSIFGKKTEAKHEAAQPSAAGPAARQPSAARPAAGQPSAARPAAGQTATGQTATGQTGQPRPAAARQPSAAQPSAGQPGSAQARQPTQQTAQTASQQTARSAPPPAGQVDVEAVLEEMSAKSGQKLNWRTSIVDLMKLLDMDSSLSERKELAQELGYTGPLDGSAEMNTWLHKRVLQELAAHGGKIPPSMLN